MTKQEIIGGLLKTARENTKLTQNKLAELVGENKANISAMERGKRSISKKMAQKLAKALNVPYHTFL
jgi:transcriptional regulator with XRE-family HTH domain